MDMVRDQNKHMHTEERRCNGEQSVLPWKHSGRASTPGLGMRVGDKQKRLATKMSPKQGIKESNSEAKQKGKGSKAPEREKWLCKSSSNKSLNQTQAQVSVLLGIWIETQSTLWAENGFEQVPGAFYFKLVISYLQKSNMMENATHSIS